MEHPKFNKLKEKLATPGLLEEEYKDMCKKSQAALNAWVEENGCPYGVALARDNWNRNRYSNALPFTRNGVALHDNDYINASWIADRQLIITQGPTGTTFSHFWEMIWERNSPLIIMLTKLREKGYEKCFKYFPDEFIELDNLRVTFVSTITDDVDFEGHLVHRVFELTHKETGKTKKVTQIHYREWPDFGAPTTTFIMRKVMKLANEALNECPESGPMVVHCSAGLGRAGTFTALYLLAKELEETGTCTDIPGMILRLREQRQGLVQSEEQYRFLYQALHDHALHMSTGIEPVDVEELRRERRAKIAAKEAKRLAREEARTKELQEQARWAKSLEPLSPEERAEILLGEFNKFCDEEKDDVINVVNALVPLLSESTPHEELLLYILEWIENTEYLADENKIRAKENIQTKTDIKHLTNYMNDSLYLMHLAIRNVLLVLTAHPKARDAMDALMEF